MRLIPCAALTLALSTALAPVVASGFLPLPDDGRVLQHLAELPGDRVGFGWDRLPTPLPEAPFRPWGTASAHCWPVFSFLGLWVPNGPAPPRLIEKVVPSASVESVPAATRGCGYPTTAYEEVVLNASIVNDACGEIGCRYPAGLFAGAQVWDGVYWPATYVDGFDRIVHRGRGILQEGLLCPSDETCLAYAWFIGSPAAVELKRHPSGPS